MSTRVYKRCVQRFSTSDTVKKSVERIFIGRERASPSEQPILVESRTPKEIVSELDKFVIGQTDAKKAVATSLRNRWRRLHVSDKLKHEITPLNILLIGPTGSGKTEIARRIATMVQAPFVKVEATKFTEVGIVGSSAEECIKELAEKGFKMELERKEAEIAPLVKEKVEIELLSRIPGTSSGKNREQYLQRLRDGEFETTLVDVTGFKVKGDKKTLMGKSAVSLGNIFSSPGETSSTTPTKLSVSEARTLMTQFFSEQAINKSELIKGAIMKVEQSGIVFLDEIDKIANGGGRGAHQYNHGKGEGVQKELLGLIEGTNVNTEYGQVNTEHILFIASGAFHYSSPSDLLPELQGRIPIKVHLKPLNKTDFANILASKEASLIEQTKALFKTEDIELHFTDDAIQELAETAEELNRNVENIGARRLRAIISKITEELSFNAPDHAGETITIDRAFVQDKLRDVTKQIDLSKYVL